MPGGGGASTGIEMATGISVDIAINHDPEAIRMHKANHPNTKHYCESVWDVDPVKACNGKPVALAWFSPDCKHFSKAKGGKPKDKNIRGLAWVALRWAGRVRPRVIMLENVEEFKTWGPLNRGHRPIKSKQGQTYRKFIHQLERLGYEVQTKELVAADYGAPTIRKRFFMIARCDGEPIIWPEPTHAPSDSEAVKAGLLKPYVGAYTQLDFSLPCPSIFDTAEEIKERYGIRAVRPLAPKTMERIARGLKKFVIDNPEPFIIQCNHGGERRPQDIREPMPTITGKHGFGIVEPKIAPIIDKAYGGNYQGNGSRVDEPLDTITTVDHNRLVEAKLTPYLGTNTTNHPGGSCEEPIHTITTGNQQCLISPTLIQYHSETTKDEVRGQRITDPIMTVDGSNRYGLVTSYLSIFYGQSTGQNVKEPLRTITAGDGHFGEVRAFLERYDIYESNRSNKRANRAGNNPCEKRREVLEDSKQTVSPGRTSSDRTEENGSAFEIGVSGSGCMERRETVSDACSQSNVGTVCRRNTKGDGHQPQEWEEARQQLGKSGSGDTKSESNSCSKNGAQNLQQLSRRVFGESQGIEGEGAFFFSDRKKTGDISNSGISGGEFQAHTLIKYYGQGTGQDVKEPLDTIPTHDRFGLVTIHGVDYQIVDIGLRMLEPKELYGCQGFPDDYIIDRDYTGKPYGRTEQVKRCGNAVCPPLPAALVRANLPELCVAKRTGNMRIKEEQTGQLRFA